MLRRHLNPVSLPACILVRVSDRYRLYDVFGHQQHFTSASLFHNISFKNHHKPVVFDVPSMCASPLTHIHAEVFLTYALSNLQPPKEPGCSYCTLQGKLMQYIYHTTSAAGALKYVLFWSLFSRKDKLLHIIWQCAFCSLSVAEKRWLSG